MGGTPVSSVGFVDLYLRDTIYDHSELTTGSWVTRDTAAADVDCADGCSRDDFVLPVGGATCFTAEVGGVCTSPRTG